MTAAVLDKLNQLVPDVQLPKIPFRMRGYDGPTTPADMTEECQHLADARAAIQGPYQRRPGDVRTLLWRARALDIPVGVAIDHIYISMQGKAGLSAQLIAALLRRAGITWTTVSTPHQVAHTFFEETWYLTSSGKIRKRKTNRGTVAFTLDEARTAGIAGSRHWQRWPEACMWARAMARAGRWLFPDITMGFAYTPEELNDGSTDDTPPVDEQIRPEVEELVQQALSQDATAHLIKTDIMVRAKRYLKDNAGDGRKLADVLADIWQQKIAYETDQETAVAADTAMAEAGITGPPPPAPDEAWKTQPVGAGDLPCGCPSSVLLTDIHLEGCTGVHPQ
jgi:hypothetical protein